VGVKRKEDGWIVSLTGYGGATCPACRTRSGSRHSSYLRSLRDLPVQGTLHGAHRLELKGESMRKLRAAKTKLDEAAEH
jgi:hypothetical protein